MPKDTRKRSTIHERPIAVNKRQFAVQDNAVEHVDVGQQEGTSAEEILYTLSQDDSQKLMKKKDKQAIKHELFIQRLESSRSPYSKSHERRLKRKAREQVAGGLQDMAAAISAVESDIPAAVQNSVPSEDDSTVAKDRQKVHKNGLIGEGKGAPLTGFQRKRTLQTERLRMPMILSNSDFSSNPFQTIRTHAQNTLVKHTT